MQEYDDIAIIMYIYVNQIYKEFIYLLYKIIIIYYFKNVNIVIIILNQ